MTIQLRPRSGVRQTISHVNLHYATPEDGPAAARLMELLGLVKTQEMPLPTGGLFYRFTVNEHDINQPDGIVYLSPLPPATAGLFAAMRERLGVGGPDEHPAVAAYRAANAIDPEFNLHVGFLVDSLEFIEERFAALRDDPELSKRSAILVNRALPGDPAIDARLDASPLYKDVTRYTYGRNGVQAFISTDLIVDGPLAERMVIEFDYVFPGYAEHIMSVSEVTPETAREIA